MVICNLKPDMGKLDIPNRAIVKRIIPSIWATADFVVKYKKGWLLHFPKKAGTGVNEVFPLHTIFKSNFKVL